MEKRARWTLIALTVFSISVVFVVPSSRAQVAGISKAVLLLPKTVLSSPPNVSGGAEPVSPVKANGKEAVPGQKVIVGASYKNDTSPPLREMKQVPLEARGEHEANANPKLPSHHKDSPDSAVQNRPVSAPNMPVATL